MIFLKVFIQHFFLFLLMTPNAFNQSHHLSMLLIYKMTSTLYLPGASPPTFHSMNPSLSIFTSGKKQLTNTPTYTVNSNTINLMTQHKDLGVNFSNNFHWSKHYEIIITKAYQTLGLLCHTFKLNSTDARKQLYISLVQSQLL